MQNIIFEEIQFASCEWRFVPDTTAISRKNVAFSHYECQNILQLSLRHLRYPVMISK